jgi:hypothetical protein
LLPIRGYSIVAYLWLFHCCLFVVILLLLISGYFISAHWLLFYW